MNHILNILNIKLTIEIKDGPQMELIHSKLLTFMAIALLISTMRPVSQIINMEILVKSEAKTVSKWDLMVRGRMHCVGVNIQKRRVGEKEFLILSFVNQNHWKPVWNVLQAQSHQQMKITKSFQQQKSGNFYFGQLLKIRSWLKIYDLETDSKRFCRK